MGEKKIEAYEQEFIPGEGWVNIIPEGETTGYEDEFFNVEDTKKKEKEPFSFENLPFYSGLTDWNFSPERPTEYSAENMDLTDPQDGTLSDDYLKLLYNSVVGGVGYDLPKWLYETNPVEFLELNKAAGLGLDHLGYDHPLMKILGKRCVLTMTQRQQQNIHTYLEVRTKDWRNGRAWRPSLEFHLRVR